MIIFLKRLQGALVSNRLGVRLATITRPLALLHVIWFAAVGSLSGANWAQWRGPFLNGSTSETNLPVNWSRTEGVAWTVPMPGKSGATPIVWDQAIFAISPDEAKKLLLFCIDAASGAVRWQKVVGTGDRVMGKNNMAACSPVTDGKRVYALFGTGDFAAYDYAGNQVWHRKLTDDYGTFAILFLYGSSPLLYEGRLYVPIIQHNAPVYGHAKDSKPDRQSWLVCIDPETGKTLWQMERKTGAPNEAMQAYTTPIPSYTPDGVALILAGADCVTAHRPDNGAEMWRFPGLNVKKNPGGRIVPSPVTMPGYVFACGPKREMLVALRASASGLTDDKQVAWRAATYVPDVCTPLAYQGKLFVLDGDRQTMTCFKPETGEKIWQGKMGVREIFYASPTGADGRIYCLSEDGTAVVLAAGNEFRVLSTIPMGDGPCGSSVVAAHGRLYVRTAKHLYSITGSSK